MGAIASQITSLRIVYSAVYSDTDQRKHQSSASLAFVRVIHRGSVNSPHKWPVTRKMFPFDDVIMCWLRPDPHTKSKIIINHKSPSHVRDASLVIILPVVIPTDKYDKPSVGTVPTKELDIAFCHVSKAFNATLWTWYLATLEVLKGEAVSVTHKSRILIHTCTTALELFSFQGMEIDGVFVKRNMKLGQIRSIQCAIRVDSYLVDYQRILYYNGLF